MTARATPRLPITILAGGGLSHVSGGVGTLIGYLMQAWAARPDAPRVQVIDTRGQGGQAGGARRFGLAMIRLAWLCATRRTRLVHVHMTTRGSVLRKGLACSVAALCGTPFVVHMHGADFLPFYRALPRACRALATLVLRRAASVVVLGTGWREFLVTEAGLRASRIEVVLNGVPCPPPRPPREAGPPRILFLGRLGDRKGVPELLAALATPLLAARAWHATVAGDGEAERFRQCRDAAGLTGRIAMPGWAGSAEAAALLAQADILVLPSHHEALPMAVIEALAHGVAVITTPVGAMPELLTHGETALLVPPGDVPALAAALAGLVDDAALRGRLAQAGHALFLARLDAAATAERMLGIFRGAAGSKEGLLF